MPQLFQQMFPSWFAGIAFAAIGIGALVPAAIMSIAAANLFTRNIYKEYLKRDATPRQEARVAKITSLVVKLGAVAAIIFIDPQFSIDLQLIGGVIILQTLPAVALGLYTRWFHRGGLVAGWVAGMVVGPLDALRDPEDREERDHGRGRVVKAHFGGSAFALSKLGFDTKATIYPGLVAVLVNLLVVVVVTLVLRAMKVADGVDGTAETDYTAEREDPTVRDLPDPLESDAPGRSPSEDERPDACTCARRRPGPVARAPRRRAGRLSGVKADPIDQQRLLELAAEDVALTQLAHRRRTLPEVAAVEAAEEAERALAGDVVRAETEVRDLDRESEAAGGRRRHRAASGRRSDQKHLDSGAVAPKEMTNLQHELQSLARRQADLEDQVLELMERREVADADPGRRAQPGQEQAAADRERAVQLRDDALADIADRPPGTRPPAPSSPGRCPARCWPSTTASARRPAAPARRMLKARQCQGCRIELYGSELSAVRNAARDEVVRCENCGRILVRTAESGL